MWPGSGTVMAGPHAPLTMAVVVCLLIHLAHAACPKQSPVLEDKVARSEVVVQGRIVRQVKVTATQEVMQAEVHCVFKGGPVPGSVNISVSDDAQCLQTAMQKDGWYLIYLRRGEGGLVPAFTEDPAQSRYLSELAYVCGLNVELPTSGPGAKNTENCHPDKFFSDYNSDCPEPVRNRASGALAPALTLLMLAFTSITLGAFIAASS